MNGSAGTSAKKADDGPNGLNLTEVSSPTSGTGWTSPTTDGAYVLDGSSQYLSSADTGFVTGNGPRTIEAWVNRSSGSAENDVFAYGSLAADEAWKLSILPSTPYGNVMHLDIDTAGCNSTGAVPPGSWHYIAATYDGSNVQFYIDGASAGSCTLSHTPNTTLSGSAAIGVISPSLPDEFFNGSIDQVKFSSGAKSATEIYNYYHGL
jgi:hypothetical protein